MQVARTLPELRAGCAALRAQRPALALVPTMGALHHGHRALLDAAGEAARVASIFVNPTQFGPQEDFARYPRNEPADLDHLRDWGCDLVWVPEVATMYPPGDATVVEPAGPAERWEGTARPGHFRGVATVVAKLFGQVRPDFACFGEKDWQQLQVVRRLAADLFLGVDIAAVPTVREADGLAMASRNRYLAPRERARAPLLHTVMTRLARQLAPGAPAAAALEGGTAELTAGGFAVEYLALVDGPTLAPLERACPGARIIAAARLGAVRLIDNVGVR